MLEQELSADLRLHIAVLLMLLLTAGREAAAATSVYECSVDGRQVFSDRPCGSEVKRRDIPESNRMEAVDTRTLQHEPRTSSHSRWQSNNDPAAARQRAACNRNREQTERIHALMRRGYSAAQGIRYDERLRKLREQYQKQRCERYR